MVILPHAVAKFNLGRVDFVIMSMLSRAFRPRRAALQGQPAGEDADGPQHTYLGTSSTAQRWIKAGVETGTSQVGRRGVAPGISRWHFVFVIDLESGA
jgi:hypothetical protein